MTEEFKLEKTPPITRDFLGNEINVGNKVVYMSVHYRSLKRAVIKKITPKMVFLGVEHLIHPDSWDRQFHNQVVKI